MTNHIVMRAEVKVDCYAGESCDQIGENFFNTYCEGDKEDSDDKEDIVIKCAELPPGAVVKIEYPCCPACGQVRLDKLAFSDENGAYKTVGHYEECECGFDWIDWVRERYS